MFKGVTQYPVAYMILSSILMITMITLASINSITELIDKTSHQQFNNDLFSSSLKFDLSYEVIDGKLYLRIPYSLSRGEFYAVYLDTSSGNKFLEQLNTANLRHNDYVYIGPINSSFDEVFIIYDYGKPHIIDVLVKKSFNKKFVSMYELAKNIDMPPSLYINTVLGSLDIVKTLNGRYRYVALSPLVEPYKQAVVRKGVLYKLNSTYDVVPVNNNLFNIALSTEYYGLDWGSLKTYSYDSSIQPEILYKYGRIKYDTKIQVYTSTEYYARYNKLIQYNSIKPNYYFYVRERRVIGDFTIVKKNTYSKLVINISYLISKIDLVGVDSGSHYRALIDIGYSVVVYAGSSRRVYNFVDSLAVKTPAYNVLNRVLEVAMDLPFDISNSIRVELVIDYTFYITNPSNEDLDVTLCTHVYGNYRYNYSVKIFSSGAIEVINGDTNEKILFHVSEENASSNVYHYYDVEIVRCIDSSSITLYVYYNNLLLHSIKASSLSLVFYGKISVRNSTIVIPDSLVKLDYIVTDISVDNALVYRVGDYLGIYLGDADTGSLRYVVPGVITLDVGDNQRSLHIYDYTVLIIDSWSKRVLVYSANDHQEIPLSIDGSDVYLEYVQNILVYEDICFNEPAIMFNRIPVNVTLTFIITYSDGSCDTVSIDVSSENTIRLKSIKPISSISVYVNTDISKLDLITSLSGKWFIVHDGVVLITSDGYVNPGLSLVTIFSEEYYVFIKDDEIFIIPFTVSVAPLQYLGHV